MNRIFGTRTDFRTLANLDVDPVALEILGNEGIEVEFCDLHPPEYGFYAWHPASDPVIGLAQRLRFDRTLLRCVLWEGLGYHATAPDLLYQTRFVLRCTMLRDSQDALEHAAVRWAAARLVSRVEIRWWLDHGQGTLEDFLTTFRVTPELARERLNSLESYFPGLWERLEGDWEA